MLQTATYMRWRPRPGGPGSSVAPETFKSYDDLDNDVGTQRQLRFEPKCQKRDAGACSTNKTATPWLYDLFGRREPG